MNAALTILAVKMLAELDAGFLTTIEANRLNRETSDAEHTDRTAADWLSYADGIKDEIPA